MSPEQPLTRTLLDVRATPSETDRLMRIVDAVRMRSAMLAAAACSAAVLRRASPATPANVHWEGSLMEKFPGYLESFSAAMTGILERHDGPSFTLRHAPHASLLGAGVAALMG